jgi:MYXO-CTERM domain-containing protein
MRSSLIIGASIATVIAAGASAEITGAVVNNYIVTAEDFGGTMVSVNVSDLYLTSNDAADTALNVYNLNLVAAGQVTYFQSVTGTGWSPSNLGSIFDTDALRRADSFVTIGGFSFMDPEQAPGAGSGTGLDPNFGGNNAAYPGALAGWYNGNPPSLNGQVGETVVGLGVLVGRFSYAGDFDLMGSTFEVTWNQGLGTPGQQAGFTVVPAPGALALLGLAGLAGRRRRNG